MNWDMIEGNRKQLKSRAQGKRGKLTDNEWDAVEGNRERLVGRIRELYGKARDAIENEVSDFERGL
jgi:uncharacterized protein YjbJ (UPF0337 family)